MNSQKQYFPELIPFRDGEKWGYSDRSKRLVVAPKYSQTFPFVGDIAKVQLEDKWGLIDRDGKEILAPIYDEVGNYDTLLNSDGSCFIRKGNQCGLMASTGAVLAEIQYPTEAAAEAAAKSAGWKGGIATNHFPDMPKAIVHSIQGIKAACEGIFRFKRDEKWGLVREDGTVLLEPSYEDIEALEKGNWPFCMAGKWGLLDLNGKVVLPAVYDEARCFSNGQAACRIGHLWGAVGTNGAWIYEPKFTELGEFRDGLSAAQQQGMYGFVDEYGNAVIDFQYPNVLDFKNGVCKVFAHDHIYFIDTNGKPITEPYTRMFGPNEQFLTHLIKEDKWGLIDDSNRLILPFEYDLPRAMGQVLQTIELERIPIKKGPLLGYATMDGNVLVEPQYMTADPFCERMSLVSVLDARLNQGATPESIEATGAISGVFNYGFIDEMGKEVITPQYILAHRFQYGLAFVKNNNFQVGYITYDGTEYFND